MSTIPEARAGVGTSRARRVLIVASTFPATDLDPVPSFVRDLVVAMKLADPALELSVLAPHDPRSSTAGLTRHDLYDEYRFQYFWPRRAQRLAGQGGIVPSLQRNRLLYLLVPFFLLAEWAAVLRLTRRLRPDVINAHWIIPQGVVVAATPGWRRAPVVLSIHGGDVFTFNNPLTVRLKRFAMRRAAAVLVNSSATSEKAHELAADVPTQRIPMGVTVEHFLPGTPVAHPGLRVLFVGRLSEEKGVADLLTAVADVRARGVDVTLRVAGTGPDSSRLHALADRLGLADHVEFLGWVPRAEVGALYAWADVFAGPSITSRTGWIEALGVVFIEASAAGIPVVTTDAGGMRDVVLHDETGIVVPERSPAELARALERLAADPELRARFGAAGRAHVLAGFSWPSIAERYLAIYQSVAEVAAR
jgi:glycosyltransferase involved in cell wall biosynthesis